MKIQEILKRENVGKHFVADCGCVFVLVANKWKDLELLLTYDCDEQTEDEFKSIADIWTLEAILNTEFEQDKGEENCQNKE